VGASRTRSCPHGCWEPACDVCKPIQVPKDQLWSFRWRYKTEQHDVYSKAQFDRLCKARGLVRTTKDDLLSRGRAYTPDDRPFDTSKIQRELQTIVKEVKNPALVERQWRKVTSRRNGAPAVGK